MSGLHLVLKTAPPGAWDASVLGGQLPAMSIAEVNKLPLLRMGTHQTQCVGDCFSVAPRADQRVVIEGDLRAFHRLACGWAVGQLLVEGDVGDSFASQMQGGEIVLRGKAASGAAEQMRGGRLQIDGDVGDELGRPLPGRRSGISGGRVIVTGCAGDLAGYRMRRGSVLILGDCGNSAGCKMVAGTLVIGGTAGFGLGVGMRRGTIIVSDGTELSPIRFGRPQPEPLGIAKLLGKDLQSDAPAIAAALRPPITRSVGDLSAAGMGEVWFYHR
jgi:formylmethanofuran dehydrogenase subunit C